MMISRPPRRSRKKMVQSAQSRNGCVIAWRVVVWRGVARGGVG